MVFVRPWTFLPRPLKFMFFLGGKERRKRELWTVPRKREGHSTVVRGNIEVFYINTLELHVNGSLQIGSSP